jgi:3-oxoacyl-[acyl-carrier protein] reductase
MQEGRHLLTGDKHTGRALGIVDASVRMTVPFGCVHDTSRRSMNDVRSSGDLETGLHGRVAIVTGASRRQGIGTAICRRLARAGADICFTHWRAYDRVAPWPADDDGPDALSHELLRTGVRALAIEVDQSRKEAAAEIIDTVEATLGPVSILVNNAAYSTSDGLTGFDAETLDAHYRVNMRGTMLLCVEFARRYRGGPGGRIINLTSGQGQGPMPGELAYAATKGAIDAFTVSFAAEVARSGITVNAVNPGPTDTGWMTDEIQSDVLTRSPFGRIGQPDDAARLIAFLASDAAAWITGQIINSEGGFERR